MTASTANNLKTVFSRSMAQYAPFESSPTLAVACSGGPDSLALTLLAHDWAQAGGGKVVALIVDHGLRRESANEASTVGSWLEACNIAYHILPIGRDAINVNSAVQEQARTVRYHAMERYCREHGCLHLLLGHHGNDQIETLAFRAMRGSGVAGLAAMSSVREHLHCRLLRPLLTATKQQCIDYLETKNQHYITDTSNASAAFSRNQIRTALAEAPVLNDALSESAGEFGQARASYEALIAHHLVRCVVLDEAGIARINAVYYNTLAEPLQKSLLMRVVMCVGGHSTPPRGNKLTSLHAQLSAFRSRITSMGCIFEPHSSQYLCYREPRAAERAHAAPLQSGVCWDKRYIWHGDTCESALILPLGKERFVAVRRDLTKRQRMALKALPSLAQLSLPALCLDESIFIPYLDYSNSKSWRPHGRLVFSPDNPLAGHGFCATMRET